MEMKYSDLELPSLQGLISDLVGKSNAYDSLSQDQLIGEIALRESPESQSVTFPRFEIMNEIKHELVDIWTALDMISTERQGTRLNVLMFASYGLFYCFWNLCGKLINEVHRLGYDYDEFGPSLEKILANCNQRNERSRLITIVRTASSSQVQVLIRRNRDTHQHKEMVAFSNIDRIRGAVLEDDQVRVNYETKLKLSYSEANTLLREGFFEARAFVDELMKEFDNTLALGLR